MAKVFPYGTTILISFKYNCYLVLYSIKQFQIKCLDSDGEIILLAKIFYCDNGENIRSIAYQRYNGSAKIAECLREVIMCPYLPEYVIKIAISLL